MTNKPPVEEEMKRRKWRWIGHTTEEAKTDDSPTPCSVLCHTFQILPSITLYLHLSNKVSPPGIS
jgi:hypothetical protein